MTSAETPDISIILTTHREGRGLTPTVRALDRTIAASRLRVEVIVVCDRADAATREALERAEATGGFTHASVLTTLHVENGDLSASRNDGIAAARADIIGVLDADNLPSENWISAAHALLKAQQHPAIVHPEAIVTFGAKREVWPLISSEDPRFQPGWLAWFNAWDAFCLAHREVFERHPYRPSPPGGGFGPEDWAWNCDTVADGIPHLIVAQTTLFYRAKREGLAAAHRASLLPSTELLRDPEVARAALARLEKKAGGAAAQPRIWERYRALRFARRAAGRVLRPVLSRIRPPAPPAPIDPVLIARREEWEAVHLLQPGVPYPNDGVLRSYKAWGRDWNNLFQPEQRAYWSGIAALPSKIDVLLIAPWLRTGGADLLTMQYIAAIRRTRPDAVIALVTTNPEPSTRLGELEGVTVFELGAFRLYPQFGVRVLGSLIAQLRPGTVHVVNSTLGHDMLDRYGWILASHTRLFSATYVVDRLKDGTSWSFLYHRSRDFFRPLSAVLTDNERFVRHMVTQQGAPEDVFVVHHATVNEEFIARQPREITAAQPLRVAWAGRFDRQKRLDRLADIVEQMRDQPVEFHVYGEAVIGDDPTLNRSLERLEQAGVVRHPAYQKGFAEVASAGAEVLLLTSDHEGLPNTVLEAMASGVSVVAPNIGDIARVVNDTTGYLVADAADIDGYVAALRGIVGEYEASLHRVDAARALVEAEYSDARLDETLESLPGYLPRPQGGQASGFRWFTDDDTAALLASDAPLTFVYTGSNGHSNFGDILQNKNILRYWSARPDRTPVLFLPAFAASTPARTAALREWFRCPHIVFFAPTRTASPEGLRALAPRPNGAPVHVVGGGYLNAMWGKDHFRAIDAIASDFAASEVFFTGLQVDKVALAGFEELAARHRVPFIGLRDQASFELVSTQSSIPAIDTFDDLTEVLEDWARPATKDAEPAEGLRVAIHMNTSDYAGGAAARDVWRDALAKVAALHPTEVILLHAYDDERPEVRDTLGTVAALGEDFPFAKVTVLDTARASLESEPDAGLPAALASLRGVDFGLSSSYHTALMMTFLGIPSYLMGANSYFSQKAQLFSLPPLDEFLAEPARHLLDVDEYRATRREWVARLDAMSFGDIE